VFTLNSNTDDAEMQLLVNGQPVNVLIDSGASCNIVGTATFSHLQSKCNVQLKPKSTRLYPYGSTQPLAVEGLFTANITAVVLSQSLQTF
jgi:hypothetical protein